MSNQFSTSLADLFTDLVRCVRRYAGSSMPPLPPWINPEQKAAQFALEHPQEAERMVSELYSLLQSYVTSRYGP